MPLTRLQLCPTPRRPGKDFRPSRRYQEAGLADKRSKMLTMWVTEDEHRRLLERCDGKQLAASDAADVHWTRSPPGPANFPRSRRRCFVSLPAWGTTSTRLPAGVNAGGSSGLDRVQVVAALMAIDAGLERLRHAVLEKGADDDR